MERARARHETGVACRVRAQDDQENYLRAGPIELADDELRIVRDGRLLFARPLARITAIRVGQRPLLAHPAVALLIAGVIIVPFSIAMMVLMRTDTQSPSGFLPTLMIGLGVAAVVAACVVGALVRGRRRHGDWSVSIHAGDRRYSFALETHECDAVRALIDELALGSTP